MGTQGRLELEPQFEVPSQLLHFVSCLIYDGPAIYDVDQPAGHPVALADEGDEPYGDN